MKPRSGSATLRRRLEKKRRQKERRGLSQFDRFNWYLSNRTSRGRPTPRGWRPGSKRQIVRQFKLKSPLLERLRAHAAAHPESGRTMEIPLRVSKP